MKNYILALKKIFDFKTSSSLSEFWGFFFVNIAISIILIFISKLTIGNELIAVIYRYFSYLPLLSLGFRRLRDVGVSPWLFLIPIVNLILAGLKSKSF